MIFNVLPFTDISGLENLFIKDGNITPVPYEEISKFSQNAISIFCVKYGIYQVPTTELIKFLESEIADKESTIEIGAGNGCIGRALGIRMTDNKMQLWPEIQELYSNLQQPVVKYGNDVEEIDANTAVIKYRPHTVIGSWITEKWQEGMQYGNQWGPQEYKMFSDGVEKYIMIGNHKTHGKKKLLKIMSFRKYKFPWLISRSLGKDDNIIYVFEERTRR